MTVEDTQPALPTADSAAQPDPQTQSEGAADSQSATPIPTPVLNREQRRAQAKGKKIGPTGANPALGNFNNRANPNSRQGGASVEKRLPRTGHK